MRSNYTREERQRIVAEYIQSGKSQTVFAPEYGIKPNTLSGDEEKISEAEFLERREKEVKPHMDSLHAWLLEKKQKEMILDSSKTKEAVNYCLNRWENLESFIKYPEATFSTNFAERSVKSWVMARRNFLFSGNGKGARASCFILSLIETAKQNGIAPEDYLRCLFEKAPYTESNEDWEKLLPWNIEITPYKIRGEWI